VSATPATGQPATAAPSPASPVAAAPPVASPLQPDFYDRPVVDVARDLVGCVLSHAGASGVIVETEAYHHSEPACHAYVGLTTRTSTLFGPPGHAYVYRSYGIHALVNAVCEPPGVGAAVLIRALEPLDGIELMRARRGRVPDGELCSGPGKLTQALAIELDRNATPLTGEGAIAIAPRSPEWRDMDLHVGPRIGIRRAAELPWRFCARDSHHVSRPRPRAPAARPARAVR
jgi:DNA-3-methyladenine glycosylase